MFARGYPGSRLLHELVLQCFGSPRNVVIVPDPGPSTPPPETVHENSAIVKSPEPGYAFVVEWTGGQVELHRVRLIR
jgi:hypothetical protein